MSDNEPSFCFYSEKQALRWPERVYYKIGEHEIEVSMASDTIDSCLTSSYDDLVYLGLGTFTRRVRKSGLNLSQTIMAQALAIILGD